MALDTSLYKLNKNAFRIVSDSGQEMVDMALDAIDAKGSPKQPYLENKLIQVGALWEQVMEFLVFNANGTQIIGIRGADVAIVNQLLTCLQVAAGIQNLSQFPTPLTPIDNDSCCVKYDVGSPGTILVSDGTTYVPVSATGVGQVPIFNGITTVWTSLVGNGIPGGGLTGQVLRKVSDNSFDVAWQTLTLSAITDVTASSTEVNILTGVNVANVGAAQINTLSGINTAFTIQQQLDSKMSNQLPQGQFFVGNASGVAAPVTPTGDVTFDLNGVFNYTADSIVNADINSAADIGRNKLASGSSWRVVINNASGVMTDASAITGSRALISDANGIPTHSPTDALRLSYISTLTSNAQDQLNGKLTVNLTSPAPGDILKFNGTDWVNIMAGANGTVLTSTGTDVVWGSSTANGIPIGGTTHQVLRKIDNTNYSTEWHTLLTADITDITATAAELNVLDGVVPTLTFTEINHLDGVTSNIQTQLDYKLNRSLSYNAIFVGDPGNIPVMLPAGADNEVLTIINGAPVWQPASPPGNVSGVAPSTDNAIVRWNGISADSIQNSAVIIDDTNNITGVTSLSSGQIDINRS